MSYIIDDELLNDIRDKIDIVNLISQYVHLKKSGSNYMGLCPFHGEKTPSFSVSPSKGIFHCFGCGVGGDQISFIMKRENLGFREAVKFLADKYGIELKNTSESINTQLINKKNRAYEANREAAKFFMLSLSRSKSAYMYLKNRNIDNDTIRDYGLGYAPDSWNELFNYLSKKGFNGDELEEFNLVSKSKSGKFIDRFRNRIMFPIIDTKKRVIGFGGRVLDDSLPKYLNTRDTIIFNKGKHLYNLNIISEKSDREKIILVEGYMDVISLYKSGINYSVASLGTSLTEEQAELIKRYGKEVYICYDGDSAGIKATNRAIDILIIQNIKPKILTLPEKLDPDEYVTKYGKLSFEIELKNSQPYLEYKISKIRENYNIESPDGLSGFTSEVSKLISRIKNPIEMDIYVDKISKQYGVSKNSIINYILILNRNKKNKEFNKKTYEYKNKEVKDKKISINTRYIAEDQLIKYALYSNDNFELIDKKINSCEFTKSECRIIFEELAEYYRQGIDFKDVLKNLVDKKLISQDYADKINIIEINQYSSDKIISELIGTLKKDSLEYRRKDILQDIKNLEKEEPSKKNSEILKLLIDELNEINKTINISQ
ncbi:DNA primase [Peptoniphilus sp. oral taxon 386]|uniref:DNA primase n=1 Tax=Peptoniphilus sp. oral taxon 386 TaxID=652713 RepID=UPI0001DA9BC4|nr:DNA primase [Peptoniphilus sp. oral taxon 386]EFI42374.1 DNA primase [Peptoniphilus sp. oral taxon 386 str. F0131]